MLFHHIVKSVFCTKCEISIRLDRNIMCLTFRLEIIWLWLGLKSNLSKMVFKQKYNKL